MTVVDYVNPPIPERSHDYVAYLDGEPGSPQGYGPTAEAAKADLLDQLEE